MNRFEAIPAMVRANHPDHSMTLTGGNPRGYWAGQGGQGGRGASGQFAAQRNQRLANTRVAAIGRFSPATSFLTLTTLTTLTKPLSMRVSAVRVTTHHPDQDKMTLTTGRMDVDAGDTAAPASLVGAGLTVAAAAAGAATPSAALPASPRGMAVAWRGIASGGPPFKKFCGSLLIPAGGAGALVPPRNRSECPPKPHFRFHIMKYQPL